MSVAGVVVRDDGRVLAIQRRDNARWEAPGGVLELDETFEDGVRREILEETGVEVHVEHLSGVYKNMIRGVVALVFLCRPLTTVTALSTDEARQIAWLTLDEITALTDEAYSIRVLDAFDNDTPARVHDGAKVLRRI